jgi:hypothetical protein
MTIPGRLPSDVGAVLPSLRVRDYIPARVPLMPPRRRAA